MRTTTQCWLLVCLFGIGTTTTPASARRADPNIRLQQILARFEADYAALRRPGFARSYEQNLRQLPGAPALRKAQALFHQLRRDLTRLTPRQLKPLLRVRYRQLRVAITTELMRLRPELSHRQRGGVVPKTGLYRLAQGRQWYRLYLRLASSSSLSPQAVLRLGDREIRRITGELDRLRRQSGFKGTRLAFYRKMSGPGTTFHSAQQVAEAYRLALATLLRNAGSLVPLRQLPTLTIQPMPHSGPRRPPGYYHRGVFYYNAWRHSRGTVGWLLLHEGVPGHHYEITHRPRTGPGSGLSRFFRYPGYVEGWGAYCETLGAKLGLYRTLAQRFARWEWDLVRAVRVVLDVRIHRDGWSGDRSLRFWRQHLPHLEAVAKGNIARIVRWPGQVVSYKVGELQIRRLRAKLAARQGARFDLKRFHAELLRYGPLPFDELTARLLGQR